MAAKDNTPVPAIKAHVASEIADAASFVATFKTIYQFTTFTDQLATHMLVGYKNYLDTSGSILKIVGSGSLTSLIAGGYV